jgi:hypothetical protein
MRIGRLTLTPLLLVAVVCAVSHASYAMGNLVLDPLQPDSDTGSTHQDAPPPTLFPTAVFAPNHQLDLSTPPTTQEQAVGGKNQFLFLPILISDEMRQRLPPPSLYGPG